GPLAELQRERGPELAHRGALSADGGRRARRHARATPRPSVPSARGARHPEQSKRTVRVGRVNDEHDASAALIDEADRLEDEWRWADALLAWDAGRDRRCH